MKTIQQYRDELTAALVLDDASDEKLFELYRIQAEIAAQLAVIMTPPEYRALPCLQLKDQIEIAISILERMV